MRFKKGLRGITMTSSPPARVSPERWRHDSDPRCDPQSVSNPRPALTMLCMLPIYDLQQDSPGGLKPSSYNSADYSNATRSFPGPLHREIATIGRQALLRSVRQSVRRLSMKPS